MKRYLVFLSDKDTIVVEGPNPLDYVPNYVAAFEIDETVSGRVARYALNADASAYVDMFPDMTDEQVVEALAAASAAAAAAAEAAARAAAANQEMTRLDFLRRLTMEERVSLRNAAKTDVIIADFLQMLELAESIVLRHPDTVAAIEYAAQQGYLTTTRATAILTP